MTRPRDTAVWQYVEKKVSSTVKIAVIVLGILSTVIGGIYQASVWIGEYNAMRDKVTELEDSQQKARTRYWKLVRSLRAAGIAVDTDTTRTNN